MNIADELKKRVGKAAGTDPDKIKLEHPDLEEHGDYSTNIALTLKGGIKQAREIAEKIDKKDLIEKIETAGPGFINIKIKREVLLKETGKVIQEGDNYGCGNFLSGKKFMVEYAHPNTHKELHIGHMRTLITGEALARILKASGALVFRANYQGDIGPHVAKAIWGTEQLLKARGLSWETAEKMNLTDKAHLLGEGYVRGNKEYEANKQEIDNLNNGIYSGDEKSRVVYSQTRRWSLEYYDTFYSRFTTKFDKLYFESEVTEEGKKIVKHNIGKVFDESEGAVIFKGEKYGLHTRVFITGDGNTTYEGKELALAYKQYADFPFDLNIHVVANEQAGYFQVVIKALELINPKFKGREYHLPMGMVNLVGRKISSRTGDFLTVDGLLEEVKELLPVKSSVNINEAVAIGAVKYSVLRTQPTLNVAFDIKQSVNLEGNSGPYLQYTYARTRSVLVKSRMAVSQIKADYTLNDDELHILKYLYRFPDAVEEAAKRYSPNLICNYLYELAKRFNTFYNQHSILSADNIMTRELRLNLTAGVSQILKNGMRLLGIEALERM